MSSSTEGEHPWTCQCKMCASVQVALNRLISGSVVLERLHLRVIQQVELSEEELQVLAGADGEEPQGARP